LLLRLQPFPYRGEPRLGALIKVGESIPPITMEDSIVAVDGQAKSFPDYWRRGWRAIRGQRNQLLVLGGSELPSHIARPPTESGFEVITGARAVQLWQKARLRWIACHPEVAKLQSDPKHVPGTTGCGSTRSGNTAL
jgi:hypothetical protein